MGTIFLSYASEDRQLARDLQARLRQYGHDVFFDEDSLKPSDGYDSMIRSRISRSDAMIFLCSPAALEKGRYTLTELGMAQRIWSSPEGRVLPVLIGDVTFDCLPSYIKGLSAYRYKGDPVSEVAAIADEMAKAKVKQRLSGYLGAVAIAAMVIALVGFWYFGLGGTSGQEDFEGNSAAISTSQPRASSHDDGVEASEDGDTSNENLARRQATEPIPSEANSRLQASGRAQSRPLQTSLQVVVIDDANRAWRRSWTEAHTGPILHHFCDGQRFSIYNASTRPLPLGVAAYASEGYRTIGVIPPNDTREIEMDSSLGIFLIDLAADENPLQFIDVPRDC